MGWMPTVDYLLQYPLFAGINGGGGNRTRVGSEPENALLQERLKACAASHEDQNEWMWEFRILLRRLEDELCAARTTTNLYVVFDGDCAKVGIAKDPLARVKNLQVSNPRPLVLYGAAPANEDLERFIHGMLLPERVRGEWFRGPRTEAIAEEVLSWAQILAGVLSFDREDGRDEDLGVVDTVNVSISRIDDALFFMPDDQRALIAAQLEAAA